MDGFGKLGRRQSNVSGRMCRMRWCALLDPGQNSLEQASPAWGGPGQRVVRQEVY